MSDQRPGFNISTFRSIIREKGVLKPNQFLVRIPRPAGLTVANENYEEVIETNRMLEYWAQSAVIPGVSMQTHSVIRYGYGGAEVKPFRAGFQAANFIFTSDAFGENHRFFNAWSKLIINHDLSRGVYEKGEQTPTSSVSGIRLDPYEIGYKYEYASDINVISYNERGDAAIDITLREAFPVAIGDLDMNWADNAGYIRLPVQFAFHDVFLNARGVNELVQSDDATD